MERIVNLGGPELLRIKAEHFRSRQFLGIKGTSPGGVLITGRADEWVHVEIIGKEFKEFKELQGGRARSQEPGARIQESGGVLDQVRYAQGTRVSWTNH
jgi:hypothetical protein